MERLRSLGLAQRIVVVVALAGVFRTVGVWWAATMYPAGGWFNYAPLSESPYLAEAGRPTGPALVWLVLIVLWAVLSVWLLGLGRGRQPPEGA
jgi:hypothetical protein